jgi:spore germination protein KB
VLDQSLTRRQAIAILLMFNFGSSVVMGVSSGVAQDSWISLLLAAVYAVPVLLMYGRIIALNPGEGLFSAAQVLLGKFFGKLVTLLMSWFALHLGALVLRNFSEFIQISTLQETPQLPVAAIMMLTVCALAGMGGKALGKWAVATAPVVLFIVVLTVVLSLNIINPQHVLPVFEHAPAEIAKDAFQIFSFPFAETVLFLSIADLIRPSDRPGGIYMMGLMASGTVLLIILLRNLTVLGPAVVSVEYFPSYAAARIINLGDFLSRIEGSISINFMLAGITKIALCVITASRGIASLFGVKDWKMLVLPSGLTALMLSVIVYGSTMEMFSFVKVYPYYAIPFEIALPLILWIVSEVRARKTTGRALPESPPGE